jgi:hypothetical protein
MNLSKYISIILLLLFAVALVQCSKEENKEQTLEEIELRDTSSDCLPELGPNCFQFDTIVRDLQLSQFPGCTFKVQYSIQYCFLEDYTWEINIGQFRFLPVLQVGCPEFDDIVGSLRFDTVGLEDFVLDFYSWIRDAIMQYELENIVQPGGGIRVMFSNYFASCSKICFFYIADDYGGKGGGTYLAIMPFEIKCGEDCCAIKSEFVWENDIWNLLQREVISPDDPCEVTSSEECPPETEFSTDCIMHCISLTIY